MFPDLPMQGYSLDLKSQQKHTGKQGLARGNGLELMVNQYNDLFGKCHMNRSCYCLCEGMRDPMAFDGLHYRLQKWNPYHLIGSSSLRNSEVLAIEHNFSFGKNGGIGPKTLSNWKGALQSMLLYLKRVRQNSTYYSRP